MKEKGTCGSHLKKKQNKNKRKKTEQIDRGVERVPIFFFLFSYFISQIHENLTFGIRRVKNEKCSTRRGLRVGTKNTGFHQELR